MCLCPLCVGVCLCINIAIVCYRFDSELTQALEEAENERQLKDKVTQENTAMGGEIYSLRHNLQVCFYSI